MNRSFIDSCPSNIILENSYTSALHNYMSVSKKELRKSEENKTIFFN